MLPFQLTNPSWRSRHFCVHHPGSYSCKCPHCVDAARPPTSAVETVASSVNDTDDAVMNVLGHVLLHMHPSRIIQVQSQCDVLLVVQ